MMKYALCNFAVNGFIMMRLEFYGRLSHSMNYREIANYWKVIMDANEFCWLFFQQGISMLKGVLWHHFDFPKAIQLLNISPRQLLLGWTQCIVR